MLKSKIGLTLAAVTLLVSGCGITGGEKTDTFCLTQSPRYYTDAEIAAMSDERAKQNEAFNEYGAKRCGWKRSRK